MRLVRTKLGECRSASDITDKLRKASRRFGKKILLVGPLGQRKSIYNSSDYLAFATLTTALKGRWEVNTAKLRNKDHLRELLQWEPAVVGITSTSPDHIQALEVAKEVVRESEGKILVIKGGIHETHCSKVTIENHPEIDVSFAGEADITLPSFLDGELLSGITYRDKGSIISPRRPILLSEKELNDLPLPDVKLLERSLKWGLFGEKSVVRVMTQRGCSYHCAFCASSGPMRQINVDTVVSYLKRLVTSGFQAIFYEDSTFTLDRERTMQLLHAIVREGIRLPSGAQTRMDRLDPEMIELMRKARFTYIYPGAESFDDGVLRSINKRLTVEQIFATVEELKKAGIEFGVPVARGFPGDSEEIYAATLRTLLELEPHYVFLESAKIYPGTGWSRAFGESTIQKAYDKGIQETANLENPEDRGTFPYYDPAIESMERKIREFKRSYKASAKILGTKYEQISVGCYRLK